MGSEESEHSQFDLMSVWDPKVPLFERNWPGAYCRCPWFSKPWEMVHDSDTEWPEGYHIFGNFIFFETKICIPTALLPTFIHSLHSTLGHIGRDRLMHELFRRYVVPNVSWARQLVTQVSKQCETCQANEHPHVSTKFPMSSTPIPPTPKQLTFFT